MSNNVEHPIRDMDLEAGWQRYAGIRWRQMGAPPFPAALDERNAFGAGAAWMLELLVCLGERPHEMSMRIQAARQQLHAFVIRTKSPFFN